MAGSPVPQIFDPRRTALRQARARTRRDEAGAATWLREALADDVVERLGFLRWAGKRALVSGDWSGRVTGWLEERGVEVAARDSADLEQPLPGGPFDLAVSLAELDTVNDLPGALILLRKALRPGGLLIAAFPGSGSLPVLRGVMLAADGATPAARVHPQVDARAASGLLQRAGFSRQAVDHHALTVRYGALARLVADLRDQALTSVLADRAPALGKAALERANIAFIAHAEGDGKISETFEIVTITAWKD